MAVSLCPGGVGLCPFRLKFDGLGVVGDGLLVVALVGVGIPAVGMGAEIGLAYDGKARLDKNTIEEAKKNHTPREGTELVYLDPQRITDVSTPQARRGRIIYSHFKEIGY